MIKGFEGVFTQYGFEEHHVNMSEPMSAEEMAKYWVDFINGHIPNFNKQPIDQIEKLSKDGVPVDMLQTAIYNYAHLKSRVLTHLELVKGLMQ